MAPDLSLCRPVFDRDPVRYLDITEPLRRGTGKLLAAGEDGALVEVHPQGAGDVIYTLWAADGDAARRLCELIPPHPAYVTVHETCSFPALRERFGYRTMNPCWQAAYLDQTPLPLPELPFTLRPLTPEDLPLVRPHYTLVEEAYLVQRLEAGAITGAFDGSALAGFAGTHAEGTVGLLEVLPAYRRRGLGRLLQSHITNLELARGHIPYGQVFDGNSLSLALQRSLSFQCSRGQMYWPEF